MSLFIFSGILQFQLVRSLTRVGLNYVSQLFIYHELTITGRNSLYTMN